MYLFEEPGHHRPIIDPALATERGADDTWHDGLLLHLRGALAALDETQRVPIEMAYFNGMSYREVALELGEAEGTVKYRIRMGMQKLRAALRTTGVTP